MPRAFVVKALDDDGWPIPGVFEELRAGRARIGWSSRDDQCLKSIQEKVDRGEPLNEAQQKAKRCLGFLTKVASEDYLLYPHQPENGWFCVVRVTGDYDYSTEKVEGLAWGSGDFRSFRPCELITTDPVARYDEIVPSKLRYRLGVPGRFSEISDLNPLFTFLRDIPEAGRIQDDSNRASVRKIHNELRKKLPDALHREFSRADLSRKLCPDLFERMGYSFVVQEGPADAGSDVVVTVGDPLLPDSVEFQIGVQVFSAEGTVKESYFQSKLDQLLQGWDDNHLDYGALLTTGRCSKEARELLRKHNQNTPKRLVRLIDGDELADLFLQYFPPGDG